MDPAGSARRSILVACILGSVVVFLDGSVVTVALPALAAELDAGLAGQQWVVDAYLLTLSSLLLLGGSVGDLLGRRRVFELSLAGFGAASALCALAPSEELLIAARALQGIDGAFLVPSSLAIIAETFDGEQRGRAVGTWTAWTGVAFLVGPLVAGLMVEVSWRLVFAINIPLVAATIAVLRRACPPLPARGKRPGIDWTGALLCALALAGPVYALIAAPARGFGSALVLGPLIAGACLMLCFVLYERRLSEPMLDVGLFRERNFSAANLVSLGVYAGLGASSFVIVLFLQQVAGYSALGAGLALMPITAVMLVASSRFGALAERIGPRLLMTAGPLVAAGGLALLVGIGDEVDFATEVLPATLAFGLGLAMTVAPLTALVLGSVPAARLGIASGVNNAVSRVASLIAIAAVGAVAATAFDAELTRRLGAGDAPAAEVAAARARPLSAAPGAGPLADASRAASARAFDLAIAISAALIAAGGLAAALAVRNPPRG